MKVILIKNRGNYLIDSVEEYLNKEKNPERENKENVKIIWEGIYDYLAYDKDNLKNEYKIYIFTKRCRYFIYHR